jgi:hypothetical protein
MARENVRATDERSAGAGSFERFAKVTLEFFIGEFSCLIATPD